MIGTEGIVFLRPSTKLGPREDRDFGALCRLKALQKHFHRKIEIAQQFRVGCRLVTVGIKAAQLRGEHARAKVCVDEIRGQRQLH